MDISSLSDTDLMKALGVEGARAPAQGASFSPASLSDADLMKALGREMPAAKKAESSSSPPANTTGLTGTINAASGGALDLPIVGPAIKGGSQRAAAGIRSVMYGTPYDAELKAVQDYAHLAEVEHPVANVAGNLGGNVAATVALGGTPIGAQLLGLTGKTLPAMVTRGALSGAGISGADAVVRGEDPVEAAKVGGIIGGALPVGARVVGKAFNGARDVFVRRPSEPANVAEVAGVKVPLSRGDVTGDFDTQMTEQAMARNAYGAPAQRVAEQFREGQRGALDQANEALTRRLDPAGSLVADNHLGAAEMTSDAVKRLATEARGKTTAAYKELQQVPGEFTPSSFGELANKVRETAFPPKDAFQFNEQRMPFAADALRYLDANTPRSTVGDIARPPNPGAAENQSAFNQLLAMGINPERASKSLGISAAEPITMNSVENIRKGLAGLYTSAKSAAMRSNDFSDLAAITRIRNAFDAHVADTLKGGAFSGDAAMAGQLQSEARQQHTDFRKAFTRQGAGDEVGRVMEQIRGKYEGQSATPEQISNWLFGASGVGNASTGTKVAQHLKSVLGESSPEWSAVRQGMWSKLTQAPEGMTEWGPQKASQRIFKFLQDGSSLPQVLFSPQERQEMLKYANLLKTLTPKTGTVNTSGSATLGAKLMGESSKHIMALLGLHTAGPVGALAVYGANSAIKGASNRAAAGRAARTFYGPASSTSDQDRAQLLNRIAGIAARAGTPEITDRR